MKKFHFERGVSQRTRVSFVLVALLVFVESTALQHFYLQNINTSASTVDTPYLEKLQTQRDVKQSTSTKVVFAGDVMLARTIGTAIESGQNPFQYVQAELDKHDIQVVNVETTIADPQYTNAAVKPYTFNSPLSAIQIIRKAGIDIASLANNHTGDYGRDATINTIEQFKSTKIQTVGAGKSIEEAFEPKYVESEDIKIAFIAVNDIELAHTKVSPTQPGSAYLDADLIKQSIDIAKNEGADVVVVLPHWGIEYSPIASANQQQWGRFMIDAGADLVIGSHPHVVQPTEDYNGGQIVYSLGNFVFDGMSGDALKGQMISVDITKTISQSGTVNESSDVTISPVKSLPILINELGFPKPI